MNPAGVGVLLVFHSPFLAAYALLAVKYRELKSMRLLTGAFVGSYLLAFMAAGATGGDDPYGFHLLALALITPWVLWYYAVLRERPKNIVLSSLVVLMWSYAIEAVLFAAAAFASLQIFPFRWQ